MFKKEGLILKEFKNDVTSIKDQSLLNEELNANSGENIGVEIDENMVLDNEKDVIARKTCENTAKI